jgi:hypothetical protein
MHTAQVCAPSGQECAYASLGVLNLEVSVWTSRGSQPRSGSTSDVCAVAWGELAVEQQDASPGIGDLELSPASLLDGSEVVNVAQPFQEWENVTQIRVLQIAEEGLNERLLHQPIPRSVKDFH